MGKLLMILGLVVLVSAVVLATYEEPTKEPEPKEPEEPETTDEPKSLGAQKSGSKSDSANSGGSKSDGSKNDGSQSLGSKTGGSKSGSSKGSSGSKNDTSNSPGSKTGGSKSGGSPGSKTGGSKSGGSKSPSGSKNDTSNSPGSKTGGSKSGSSKGPSGSKSKSNGSKTPGSNTTSKSESSKGPKDSKSSGSKTGGKSGSQSKGPKMRPRRNIKCSGNTELKCWTCSNVFNDTECHSNGQWERCTGTKPTCFLSRTANGQLSRGCVSTKTCNKKKPVDCIDMWGNAVTGQDCKTCGNANDCWYKCGQPDKRGKCSFKCKTCDGVTDPKMCKKSKTCKMSDPTCEMTTKTDRDGVLTYHYGCKQRVACLNQPGTKFGCHMTGNGRVCTTCVDDKKPKCQFGPGGKDGDEKPAKDRPVPEPRCNEAGERLQCWACKNAKDEEDCSNQKDAGWQFCNAGEICYYSKKKAGKGNAFINRGCMARNTCNFQSCFSKKGKKAAECGNCNIGCLYRCKPQADVPESSCGHTCLSCTNANETECRQSGLYEQCHMHDPVCEEIWTKNRLSNKVTFTSRCRQRRACQNQPSLRPECKTTNSKFECSQCEEGIEDCSFERLKSKSKSLGSKSSKGPGSPGSKGTGSQGSKGPGSTGSKGTGSQGSKGTGSPGSKGTGSQGSKGTGSPGSKGTGSQGSKGTGSPGSKGKGSKGSGSPGSKGTGSQGSQGSKGTGSPGSKGKGSQGSNGTGSPGSKGNGSQGSKGSGSPGSKGTGSQGSKGTGSAGSKGKGSQGSNGTGSPGSKGTGSQGSKGTGSPGSKGKGSQGSKGTGSAGSKGTGSQGSKGNGSRGSGGSKGSGVNERSETTASPTAKPEY